MINTLTNNSNLISKSHNLNLKSDLKYRSYQFSISIINFVNSFPSKRVYWVMADQLLRASLSIGANIIEAKASASKKDFINYFQISLKSANETKYWLSLLSDILDGKMKTEAEKLLTEAEEISKMLGSSVLTLKKKNKYV
jgi:four helix bundle protein